jgi:galactokinase
MQDQLITLALSQGHFSECTDFQISRHVVSANGRFRRVVKRILTKSNFLRMSPIQVRQQETLRSQFPLTVQATNEETSC